MKSYYFYCFISFLFFFFSRKCMQTVVYQPQNYVFVLLQSKEIEAQIAETKEEGKQVKEALRDLLVRCCKMPKHSDIGDSCCNHPKI